MTCFEYLRLFLHSRYYVLVHKTQRGEPMCPSYRYTTDNLASMFHSRYRGKFSHAEIRSTQVIYLGGPSSEDLAVKL